MGKAAILLRGLRDLVVLAITSIPVLATAVAKFTISTLFVTAVGYLSGLLVSATIPVVFPWAAAGAIIAFTSSVWSEAK